MTDERRGGHMDDAQLVRYLDDALAPLARRRARRHLERCGACADRLARVTARSSRLHALLPDVPAELPPEWLARARAAGDQAAAGAGAGAGARGSTPTPRRLPPAAWLLAAAAALVVLVLAAPPLLAVVRAWVATLADDRPAPAPRAGEGVPAVPPPVTADTGRPSPSAIRFAHAGPQLRVAFAAPEPGAELVVERTEGGQVVIESAAGDDGPRPIVVVPDDGVEVRNAARRGGRYRLWVPADVREVEVRVGGRVVATLAAPAAPGSAPIRVPLAP